MDFFRTKLAETSRYTLIHFFVNAASDSVHALLGNTPSHEPLLTQSHDAMQFRLQGRSSFQFSYWKWMVPDADTYGNNYYSDVKCTSWRLDSPQLDCLVSGLFRLSSKISTGPLWGKFTRYLWIPDPNFL